MTLTRHSLIKCRTKDCPFTPDEHDEWMELCSRAPEHGHRHDQPTHQHHPKKGMGGNNPLSKIVAVLCWPFHDRIDNKDWGNDVKNVPGRGLVYFAWDLHGNTLIERMVMPSDRRPEQPNIDQREVGRDGQVLSDGDEAAKSGSIINTGRGDEGEADPTLPRGSEGDVTPDSVAAHTSPSSPSTLTHEQRVAIAQAIKDTEWNRQWFAGDTGNLWIEELGESAEQYLSDFGYVHESLANILRVCAAIPPPYRNGNLRFSHHVVVAGENLEDVEMWLDKCAEEQWSVAEFRRQVKGTKPRVKRWSAAEIAQERQAWHTAHPEEHTDQDCEPCSYVADLVLFMESR